MRNVSCGTIILLACLLFGCAHDYERGDIAERIKEDKAWYCGPGMFGIRAVARFGLRMVGVPVPNVCKVIDVIVESEG